MQEIDKIKSDISNQKINPQVRDEMLNFLDKLNDYWEDKKIPMAKIMQLIRSIKDDNCTYRHSLEVAKLSFETSYQDTSLQDVEKYQLVTAALIHDIGKVGIPIEILNKVGDYSKRERSIINFHSNPKFIKKVLKNNDLEGQIPTEILDICASHHKSYLEQEKIAKYISVCDVFSALKMERPYKKGLSNELIHNAMMNNSNLEKDYVKSLEHLIKNFEMYPEQRIDIDKAIEDKIKQALLTQGLVELIENYDDKKVEINIAEDINGNQYYQVGYLADLRYNGKIEPRFCPIAKIDIETGEIDNNQIYYYINIQKSLEYLSKKYNLNTDELSVEGDKIFAPISHFGTNEEVKEKINQENKRIYINDKKFFESKIKNKEITEYEAKLKIKQNQINLNDYIKDNKILLSSINFNGYIKDEIFDRTFLSSIPESKDLRLDDIDNNDELNNPDNKKYLEDYEEEIC